MWTRPKRATEKNFKLKQKIKANGKNWGRSRDFVGQVALKLRCVERVSVVGKSKANVAAAAVQ